MAAAGAGGQGPPDYASSARDVSNSPPGYGTGRNTYVNGAATNPVYTARPASPNSSGQDDHGQSDPILVPSTQPLSVHYHINNSHVAHIGDQHILQGSSPRDDGYHGSEDFATASTSPPLFPGSPPIPTSLPFLPLCDRQKETMDHFDRMVTRARHPSGRRPPSLSPTGRIIVVSGVFGLGKTSFVLNYANKHADKFRDGVFYIDCSTEDTIGDGFAQLVNCIKGLRNTDLNSSYNMALVENYLSNNCNYLLILDGVDNEQQYLSVLDHKCVPKEARRAGRFVMITTMDRKSLEYMRLPYNDIFCMSYLSKHERVELLEKRCGPLMQAMERDEEAERAALDNIVEQFCMGSPMRLNLMASYIIQHDFTYAEYLTLLRNGGETQIPYGQMKAPELLQQIPVQKAFTNIFYKVTRNNPLAEFALYLASMLHHCNIPVEVFETALKVVCDDPAKFFKGNEVMLAYFKDRKSQYPRTIQRKPFWVELKDTTEWLKFNQKKTLLNCPDLMIRELNLNRLKETNMLKTYIAVICRTFHEMCTSIPRIITMNLRCTLLPHIKATVMCIINWYEPRKADVVMQENVLELTICRFRILVLFCKYVGALRILDKLLDRTNEYFEDSSKKQFYTCYYHLQKGSVQFWRGFTQEGEQCLQRAVTMARDLLAENTGRETGVWTDKVDALALKCFKRMGYLYVMAGECRRAEGYLMEAEAIFTQNARLATTPAGNREMHHLLCQFSKMYRRKAIRPVYYTAEQRQEFMERSYEYMSRAVALCEKEDYRYDIYMAYRAEIAFRKNAVNEQTVDRFLAELKNIQSALKQKLSAKHRYCAWLQMKIAKVTCALNTPENNRRALGEARAALENYRELFLEENRNHFRFAQCEKLIAILLMRLPEPENTREAWRSLQAAKRIIDTVIYFDYEKKCIEDQLAVLQPDVLSGEFNDYEWTFCY